MKSMHTRYFLYFFLFLFTVAMNGCGAKMPLAKDQKNIDIKNEPIGIFSLKISNKLAPSYQPNISTINIVNMTNEKQKKFKAEEPFNEVKNKFNEYLISFQLPPGKYMIEEVRGSSGTFPFTGNFYFPINIEFVLEPNTITYFGHIEMVNRKRKDGEIWSGDLLPLLDQAVTGFSGGTFDVTITDNYEEDLKIFRNTYPFISEYEIGNNMGIISKSKSNNNKVNSN